MTRGRAPRCAAALLVLAGAWSASVGSTQSAFTASGATGSNAFSGAPDWVAPTAAPAVAGRTNAYDTGAIKQGGLYYVYANLSDTGNPASGTAAVTANIGAVSSGHAPVSMTAGAYSAGGQSFNYRSAAQTAASTLAAGSYTVPITATDGAGNSGTQNFTTLVDNTAPAEVDVQSTNVSGGTVGHLDQGDTLTLTYSKVMDPYSILAGWDGSANGGVQVDVVDGGGNNTSDFLEIYAIGSTPAYVPLGVITLNSSGFLTTGHSNHVSYGAAGAAIPTTMTRSGAVITLTLGSASGPTSTSTTSAAMTWAPSGASADIAGNPLTTASVNQSGTVHRNF